MRPIPHPFVRFPTGATGDGAWSAGGSATFTLDALPTTLGRTEVELTWSYQYELDGTWIDIPGSHTTTHPIYVVAGQPYVPDGTFIDASPPVAWIGAIEDANEAVAGIEADDSFAVMDALREHLHHDDFLIYNPGDSSYTHYDGSYIYWNYIWVDLSDWLDRDNGVELYCHSVACVLSSLANHLGYPAEYVTIGVGFQTHLTRAAGTDSWQRWYFNSHGIVTIDGTHVWDAAVDIDGDDNPDQEPVSPVSPMGLTLEEYLELLTANSIDQVNGGRCYVY